MASHKKPTKDELRKGMEDAINNLPDDNQPTPSPSAPIPSPSQPVPTASPSPSEPVPSPSPSPTPSQPDEEDELEKQKKKAKASAQEAQILHSRTKKYDEAVLEAEGITEPTDEEMQKEYGKDEWEEMTLGQQRMAKKSWVSDKRFEIMARVSKEGKEVQEWVEKVDKFLEDPKTLNKYPVLEGKEEDFKIFSRKDTRRGLDFEDLMLAFVGDLSNNPPKKNKGSMFEKGSAGRKETPKPNDGKLTVQQGKTLRETNYKKWKEMLKAGKISNE